MNRRPLNRSGFNRPSTSTSSATGLAQLKLGANPVSAQRTISILPTRSQLAVLGSLQPTNTKYGGGVSDLSLASVANATQVLDGGIGTALLTLLAEALQSVQGEAVITLEGLVLVPGDELIINTQDMTITLNGQNGTEYFSADSEFFTLLSGENTIIYSDGEASRKINLDVIWKDRWL
jgi:hypothetical protein